MASRSPLEAYLAELESSSSDPVRAYIDELKRQRSRAGDSPNALRVGPNQGSAFGLGPTQMQSDVAGLENEQRIGALLGSEIKESPSFLERVGGALTTAGELTRGIGYGTWNNIARNVLDDESLVIDVSGDGVVDDKDFIRGQVGVALSPTERVQGFGSFEPLKVEGDDGLLTRIGKYAGAFALDTALDPTTYVTAGTGALGRTAAAELTGKVLPTLGREALEAAGDDVVTSLARSAAARRAVGRAAGGNIDEAAEAILRESDDVLGLAADELGLLGQSAYRRGTNTALRKELTGILGDDAGNQLFQQLPGPVRGGLRMFGKEVTPKGVGGGQVLSKLGGAGDAAISAIEKTVQVRNRLGGALGSRFTIGQTGAAVATAKQAAVQAAQEIGKRGAQEDAEQLIRAAAAAKLAKQTEKGALMMLVKETTQQLDAAAKTHGEDRFWSRTSELLDLDSPELDAEVARITADTGATQFEKDAATAAKTIRDTTETQFSKYRAQYGADFSAVEELPGTNRRVLTDAEKARRSQTLETGGADRGGSKSAFKARTQYQDPVTGRWLRNTEINTTMGRDVFETDARKIWVKAMGDIERGIDNAVSRSTYRDMGVLVDAPRDLLMDPRKLGKLVEGRASRVAARAERVRSRAASEGRADFTPLEKMTVNAAERVQLRLADITAEVEATAFRGQRMTELRDSRRAAKASIESADRAVAKERRAALKEIADLERQADDVRRAMPAGGDQDAALVEIELRKEAAAERVVALRDEASLQRARLDAIDEEIASTNAARQRARNKMERAEAALRKADTARKRLAERQAKAAQREEEILAKGAAVFAEEQKLNDLLRRIATEQPTQQDELYKEMAATIITQRDEWVAALDARAARYEAAGVDAAAVRAQRDNAKRGRDLLEQRTDRTLSTMQGFLDNQNMVRVGTEKGKAGAEVVDQAFRDAFVPASISKAFTKMHAISKAGDANKFVSSVYDPYMKLWRTWATVGRGPGFVARNVIGGMYNALLAGAGPQDFVIGARYANALQASRRELIDALENGRFALADAGSMADTILKEKLDSLPAIGGRSMWDLHQDMQNRAMFNGMLSAALGADTVSPRVLVRGSGREIFPNLEPEAVAELGLAGRGAVRVAQLAGNNPWINAMSSVSSMSETYLRSATFFSAIRRFGGEAGGIEYGDMLVKATQFDYSDLSPAEQKIVRWVAPFWVWTRNNVPLQFRSLTNRPGIAAGALRANELGQEYFGGDGENSGLANRFRAPFLRESMSWAGGGDSPVMFGSGLPIIDLNRYATLPTSVEDLKDYPGRVLAGAADDFGSQLSPVFKTGIEGITGTNLFTGRKYGQETVSPNSVFASLPLLNREVDPETGEVKVSGQKMGALRNLIPILGTVQRVAPVGPFDNQTYRDRWGTSVTGSFLGLGGLPFGPQATATEKTIAAEIGSRDKAQSDANDAAAGELQLNIDEIRKDIKRGWTWEDIKARINAGYYQAPWSVEQAE